MSPKDGDIPDLSELVARATRESGAKDVKDESGGIDRFLESALLLSALQRWVNETGEIPTESEWDQAPNWPSPWKVKETFGSWDRMITLSGLKNSKIGKKLAAIDSERQQFQRTSKERLKELDDLQAQMQERERQASARSQELEEQMRASVRRVRDAEKLQATAERDLERVQQLAETTQNRVASAEQQLRDKDDEIARLQAMITSLRPADVLWTTWLTGSETIDVEAARSAAAEILTTIPEQIEALKSMSSTSVNMSGAMNAVVICDADGDSESWALVVTDNDGNASLDVSMVTTGSVVELGVRAHTDDGAEIGKRILRKWAERKFLVDGRSHWVVRDSPTVIHGGRSEDWVYERLGDPKRTLPILAVASDIKGVNRSDLAKEMIGLADVTFLADAQASWLISEKFSKEWSVFGTGIRIYWPGTDLRTGDPFDHPLWVVNVDRERLDDVLSDVKERIEEWSAGQRWGTNGSSHAVNGTTLTAKLHEITDRLHAAENKLSDAQRENHGLRQRIAAFASGRDDGTESSEPGPEAQTTFSTVLEATQRASEDATALRFADAAFSSAEDSPFTRPNQIYDALMRLNTIAEEFLAGGSGRSVGQAAEASGLRWSNTVNPLIVARHSRYYTYVWNGHKLEMGPHVAIGSGRGANSIARIYLTIVSGDGDLERAVIVGHVGRHLPDSTT